MLWYTARPVYRAEGWQIYHQAAQWELAVHVVLHTMYCRWLAVPLPPWAWERSFAWALERRVLVKCCVAAGPPHGWTAAVLSRYDPLSLWPSLRECPQACHCSDCCAAAGILLFILGNRELVWFCVATDKVCETKKHKYQGWKNNTGPSAQRI